MATSSIGTNSRDYSTIAAWEAALSTGSEVGECFDDSEFDESVTIDDTDPDDITLTVADGEKNDGTAGTGARIVRTANASSVTINIEALLDWLEITHTVNATSINNRPLTMTSGARGSHLLIHDWTTTHATSGAGTLVLLDGTCSLDNSGLYNCRKTAGTGPGYVIFQQTDTGGGIRNCTLHHVEHDTNDVIMIRKLSGEGVWQNLILTDPVAAAGTATCFSTPIGGSTVSHNASSDLTASGTGSLTGIDPADQYVSTVGGSEDLHLVDADADVYEAGTDLGTTPTGVNIAMPETGHANGYDRDAEAVTWSIGAFQGLFAADPGGAFPPQRSLTGAGA
jgi:hypothetical protein